MKKIIMTLMLALSLTFGLGGVAMATSTDAARNEVCNGIGDIGANCGQGDADIQGIIRVVLQILSIVAGIAAVIMIIISGLKYITSGGDSSSVASAKSSLIYALVGLVIVALSQAIVIFVLGNATR